MVQRILSGILILLITTTAFVWWQQHKTQATPTQSFSQKKTIAPPQFDFYSMLTKPAKMATAPTTKPAAAAAGPAYYLQIASFKTLAQAQHCQTQLGSLGVQTTVSSFKANDTTWQRVMSTPFQNKADAQKALGQIPTQYKPFIITS